MKKIMLLITCILFISCEPTTDNCECKGKFAIFGQQGYFYVNNLPIDCQTRLPLKKLSSNPTATFCGCE